MKIFNNKVGKNYYVIICVLALLGCLSVFWLLHPMPAGSEETVTAEYVDTTTSISNIAVTTNTFTTSKIATTTTLTTSTSLITSKTVLGSTLSDITTISTTTTESTTISTGEDVVIIDVLEEDTASEAPIVEEEIIIEPQSKDITSIREYVVFKPNTHYIHRSTCRWVDNTCYEIQDTSGIECRKCSECAPDMTIITEYVPVVTTSSSSSISDYDRQLLAEIVMHEAGSNWITTYNKAKVAAGVMNRVYDGRFPNTVYGVLTQSGQFSGFWPGCISPSQDCYDAVDYYFNHTGEFNSDNSWWGDGSQNHFYYQ